MKRYPKIKRFGHEETDGILDKPVNVVEKMDGANFRFTHSKNVDGVEEDRLVFGSRRLIYKNEKDIDSNFEHAIEYVRDSLTPEQFVDEVERGTDSLTLYGEAMHPHTLDYNWDDVPNVLIFDAYSGADGWLGWRSIKRVAHRADLPHVPEIHYGRQYESPSELSADIESEYRDGPVEGIVIRRRLPNRKTFRAKLRNEEFLNKHASASAKPRDYEGDDSKELAHKLLRKEPWAKKWIHKYEDRGRTIEMGVIDDLWRDVFDDIIEEEYETILLGNHDLNTKTFRSEIADYVANEVRAYMERPDDSVLNE